MTAFAERLQKIAAETSTLCLGLDPSPGLLAAWELPDSAAGAREFCRRALDAAQGLIGIVKPQAAFYERFGATGVAVLDEVVAEIRDRGQLSIVDCKRGDVAHTMVAYCQGLKGNAMTLTAYLGFAALHDGLGELVAKGAGAFVVACFSDPGLEPMREVVEMPVVGPGASAMHLAAQLGSRFSIISPSDGGGGRVRARLRAMGLADNFASVRGISMSVLDLAQQREATLDRIAGVGRNIAEEDGADVLVLGCMSMAFLEITDDLQERTGMPVVNPVCAALFCFVD